MSARYIRVRATQTKLLLGLPVSGFRLGCPAMSTICPDPNLFPVPGFPAYASSPDGLDVWRVVPAQRGPAAGKPHRMRPTIHPRGREWTYLLSDASGKQRRMPISRLVKLLLDASRETCEHSAIE